jgi:hypothetical protein
MYMYIYIIFIYLLTYLFIIYLFVYLFTYLFFIYLIIYAHNSFKENASYIRIHISSLDLPVLRLKTCDLRTPSPKKQGPPEEKTFFAALRHGWASEQRTEYTYCWSFCWKIAVYMLYNYRH